MIKQRALITYDPKIQGCLRVNLVYNVKYNDAVSYAKSKKLEVKEGDKLFYLPDLTISRFKLKDAESKYNFKSIRDIEQADYIIIGQNTSNNSLKSLTTKQIKYERICSLPDKINSRIFSIACFEKTSPVYSQHLVDNFERYPDLEFIMYEQDIQDYRDYLQRTTGKYFWYKYMVLIQNYLTLPNPSLYSKLRYQEDILSTINQDSIIITDEKAEELDRMFKSNQNDNIVLAMEIMSNSNYEESIVNNYLLLIKHRWTINSRPEGHHKNFKGLLDYYGHQLHNIPSKLGFRNVENLCNMLKKYGKLTKESVHKVLQEYANVNHRERGDYCNNELRPNEGIEYDE